MQKPPPVYSLDLVLHPEHDTGYIHFEHADQHPFQPTPTGFPRVNAWWLAEAALLTYWDQSQAVPLFEQAGFETTFVTADSTDCYVASQDDFAILAFRGTQPDQWRDVLADANIIPAPWPTGLVHLGFKKAFEAIQPQLDPIVEGLGSNRTLWFCGHSLGAALATLAADHYAATQGVCTFGSPRVGDLIFADAFDGRLAGRSLRYVNDHDVVTHVPLPFPYKHVARPRFIAADGTVSDQPPALLHFFGDLMGHPQQLLEVVNGLDAGTLQTPPMFLLDHMPKAYAIWSWNDFDANE